MKVRELESERLDFWVARARGLATFNGENGELLYHPGHSLPPRKWNPSRYWSQGGPLLEEQHIDLNWDTEGNGQWSASVDPDILVQGDTLLEAAMRAYVMLKFGEEVGE